MSESFVEQLYRVQLMASGDPTWDLSDNDCAALKTVVDALLKMTAQASLPAPPLDLKVLASALRKMLPPELLAEVIAHLDPLTPFVEFLRNYDPPAAVPQAAPQE